MTNKILLAVAILAAAVVGGAVGRTTQNHPSRLGALYSVENEQSRITATGYSCGVERWAVKTMSDPESSAVMLTPKRTTVPVLRGLPVPSTLTTRNPGVESQMWLLRGTLLIAYKLEQDSDIHLELQSTINGSTMIAEIPDPNCVTATAFRPQIAAARAAFVAEVGTPNGYYQTTSKHVQITGTGFFDFVHGQRGVAPNGIELHPLLSFGVLS